MPKVGILATAAAGYFKEGGMCELKRKLEEDMDFVVKALSEELEVVYPGLVIDEEEGEKVGKMFRNQDLDLIILFEATYTPSWVVLSVLNQVRDVPLLVTMYMPYEGIEKDLDLVNMLRGAGVNGTVEITETLNRLRRHYCFIVGTPKDEKTIKEIFEYAKAAALARKLRKIKIAFFPYRCGIMPDTFEDEFKFIEQLGPKVDYISTFELLEELAKIKDEEVRQNVLWMMENFKLRGPTEKDLTRFAKFKFALEKLVEKHNINAVAMLEANELAKAIGTNPSGPLENLENRNVPVGMEGDLSTTLAMWILQELTGLPTQFVEFLRYDRSNNTVLVGHHGCSGIKLANKGELILDEPWFPLDRSIGSLAAGAKGLSYVYITKPGEATLLNISCNREGYKMVISTAEALDETPRNIKMPHAILKLRKPVEQYFKELTSEGAKHHFALVHGNVVSELEKLADILQIRKVII
jgi:L-arabinose isomerase